MKKTKEHASYIESGQNQITKILMEFEMGCDEAIIRREGKRLILEPKKRSSSVPSGLKPLKADFPNVDITLFGDFRF